MIAKHSHIRSSYENNVETHSCGGWYLGKCTLSENCVLNNPMGIKQKPRISIYVHKRAIKKLYIFCKKKTHINHPSKIPTPKNSSSSCPTHPQQGKRNPTPWKITRGPRKNRLWTMPKGQDHQRVLAWSFFVWSLPYVHVPAHLGEVLWVLNFLLLGFGGLGIETNSQL